MRLHHLSDGAHKDKSKSFLLQAPLLLVATPCVVLQQGQLVGVILVSYTQVFSGTYGLISCIHTKLGISYLMVLLFGDISIASKHLLILGKTLCNVL